MMKRTGQSLMEYTVMAAIVLAAILTMQIYIKRGISGRWKTSVDDIGDQYDPRLTTGSIRHTMVLASNTTLMITYGNMGDVNGYYSVRADESVTNETKRGTIQVGN